MTNDYHKLIPRMARCTMTLVVVCASFLLSAQTSDTARPVLTFTKQNHSFGTVNAGAMCSYDFKFRNTGNAPLIISDITRTGVNYPPDAFPGGPIAPGDSGVITLAFNTAGKCGNFWKTAAIYSNATAKPVYLHINGCVYDPNGPVLTFDTTMFCFDTVAQGTVVIHEFHFKNTGKAPLIITDAPTGCGCMVAEYPKEPIAPGKSGVVRVTLSLAGKSGPQHKIVTLNSNNSSGTVLLHMKGYVQIPVQKSPAPQR